MLNVALAFFFVNKGFLSPGLSPAPAASRETKQEDRIPELVEWKTKPVCMASTPPVTAAVQREEGP